MNFKCRFSRWSLCASALALCGPLLQCAAPPGALAATGAAASFGQFAFEAPMRRLLRGRGASGPITHVVIIVQENQSFDHIFNGYPGANTVACGKIHTGATYCLKPQDLGDDTDTDHTSGSFIADYDNGKLDGFDLNPFSPKPRLLAYTYIKPREIGPYYAMAQQYVLSDDYFTSHIDASFAAHQYLIAAQANHAVDIPSGTWGCDSDNTDLVQTLNANRSIGPLESPCFTYTTLADELDAAGLTWHYYAPMLGASGSIWSAFQAVNQIYHGPDWSEDVISPETRILEDIPNGILENVTWVIPKISNSDHPGSHSMTGPSWVASIVNAIGQSQFWDSTAIFVTWDEWGGEYDHVAPPYMDYDGDGFRVPLLCISPYAYDGVVNHTQLEAGSILRYVENTFGLGTLAAADARATPANVGCTNPSQSTPRTFTPISASYKRAYFLHQRPSKQPPDDS